MSVLCTGGKGSGKNGNVLYVKGAPDYMLDTSKASNKKLTFLDADTGSVKPLGHGAGGAKALKNIRDAQKQFARDGLRTLLMSYKTNLPFGLGSYTGPNHKAHEYLTEPDPV